MKKTLTLFTLLLSFLCTLSAQKPQPVQIQVVEGNQYVVEYVPIEAAQKNQKEDIAKGIEENLQTKEQWRSELIAEMSVGIAESWARNQEVAQLAIVLAEEGINLKKRWKTILDGRERPSHHNASGQTVGINQKFIVGGEQCNYPRDPVLSMAQSANCRCGVEYVKG